MYYEQICNILKQNGIEAEHILWYDETRGITLDSGEFPIVEYLIDEDRNRHLNYAWLLVQNGADREERGYIVSRTIQLGTFNILILQENSLSPRDNEEIKEDIVQE